MPTKGKDPEYLVDTSVAVALVLADHPGHKTVLDAIGGRRLGLAGHAAFETYSVLTRLPPPARRTAAAATRLIEANFPQSRFLPAEAAAELLSSLASSGVAGGSVYDALVGYAAKVHGFVLATRDERARDTYRGLGVEFEFVG
ncbi:MAG: type II toxin-antitoxin system VapC family toxin [Acidimicrobiales bacterium]